jgi:hypothetical protein
VLGGSHARGRAQTASDIDLGILYSEVTPFSIESIREMAQTVNDTPDPVVTNFYDWGPWVNGGAWLTIGGQRVDLIYRSLEQLERVIADSEVGRYEIHYLQQPPFGFFSGTYLGEIAACIPLFDPEARIDALKGRVASYPDALRRAVVQDFLFMAEFTVTAFAPKMAARRDTHGTCACLARAVNELVMVLFGLNGRYLINEKSALEELSEFKLAPQDFRPRVQRTFAHLGSSPTELTAAVKSIELLLGETVELANGLCRPRFSLPNRVQ